MSIKHLGEKIKGLPSLFLNIKTEVFVTALIILVGLAGFGLGRLSGLEKNRGEIQILRAENTVVNVSPSASLSKAVTVPPMSAAAIMATETAQGLLVASKSGAKYHFPWCAGASQIADKNKIWFASYEQAQKAGYTRASNCKGLE